ncbi:MAG TPA: hypothetical protein VGS28_05055 [Candidatus Saccharimonadales bacterium]|nr:hypothetical protein [Candidatus Saccharimonadales bacterium]
MKNATLRLVKAASFTCFFFGFAGWFYIAENAVFHPRTLGMHLTHFASWPHEDTFGAICFTTSFISLFIFMIVKDSVSAKKMSA